MGASTMNETTNSNDSWRSGDWLMSKHSDWATPFSEADENSFANNSFANNSFTTIEDDSSKKDEKIADNLLSNIQLEEDSAPSDEISVGNGTDNEDDEWMIPSHEIEECDDDSTSSGFTSPESTPTIRPLSPPKSPRKALPISHYKMQASTTTSTLSPRRRVEAILSSSTTNKWPRKMNLIPSIAPPPLTETKTPRKTHTIREDNSNDEAGMTPVAPRQRRLSLWSKGRRHSIDGSMHRNAEPSSPHRQNNGRRSLSFFGNKAQDEDEAFHTECSEKTTPMEKPRTAMTNRRHSIDGSMHDSAHHPTKRRLSFFGNIMENKPKRSDESGTSKRKTKVQSRCRRRGMKESSGVTVVSSVRRRLSFFGSGGVNKETAINDKEQNPHHSSKRRSSIDGSMHQMNTPSPSTSRRRFSFFGNGKKDTDNHQTEAKTEQTENQSSPMNKGRRHSMDNSMHDAPAPFHRQGSFFGTKIEYDERPSTGTSTIISPPPAVTRSKKKPVRRRNSIDGSQHENGGKLKRRLSFFGSKDQAVQVNRNRRERRRRPTKLVAI